MYAYAINGSEDRTLHRNAFVSYAYDLKTPDEVLKEQSFDVQSKSMLGDLDAFRAELGNG